MRVAVMLAATCFGIGGATASDGRFAQRDPDFPPRVYTCRAGGVDLPLGAQACLSTEQGRRLAECGFVQNVSTWKPADGACP